MCSVYLQWDFLLSTLLTTHHPCSDRAMLLLTNEKSKKESKLHNHQLLRPICVGRPENTGASASSRACCHKALMLLDVTAAVRTSPTTPDRWSPQPMGSWSYCLDSFALSTRAKGQSLNHTVHAQPRLELIPTFQRVQVRCKLAQKHTRFLPPAKLKNWPKSPGT